MTEGTGAVGLFSFIAKPGVPTVPSPPASAALGSAASVSPLHHLGHPQTSVGLQLPVPQSSSQAKKRDDLDLLIQGKDW